MSLVVPHNDTDEQLFAQLRSGEETAFDVIYQRFWEKLYSYAYHRVNPKSIAYELTQEIFVSLWARRGKINLQSSLSGYLYASMRFQIIKHIKHSKIRSDYLENFQYFQKQRSDNSNEESVMLHDLEESLEKSISQLPARCQEIFRMSRYEHLSIKQIAEQLNISTRTVENQLTRALKHLRISLGDFMILVMLWGGLK